jgi:hypothetical protein
LEFRVHLPLIDFGKGSLTLDQLWLAYPTAGCARWTSAHETVSGTARLPIQHRTCVTAILMSENGRLSR